MAGLRQFFLRIVSLFRRDRAGRELSREIESHLTLLEDECIAKGLSPAGARLAERTCRRGEPPASTR